MPHSKVIGKGALRSQAFFGLGLGFGFGRRVKEEAVHFPRMGYRIDRWDSAVQDTPVSERAGSVACHW